MKRLFHILLSVIFTTSILNAQKSENLNNHYLGEEYLDGIIYYIYTGSDGNQHGLIVSKNEIKTKYQNNVKMHKTLYANRTWDGAYNTKMLNDSPAKEWIQNTLGEDWYLPSVDELNYLWQNRFHVNKTLHKINGTLISYTVAYLTSTEILNKYGESFVLIMGFDTGTVFSNYKSAEYFVRPIRAF